MRVEQDLNFASYANLMSSKSPATVLEKKSLPKRYVVPRKSDPIWLCASSGKVRSEGYAYQGNDLPWELSEPLVESSLQAPDYIKGYISGSRSAVVSFGGHWYKIKGIAPSPDGLWWTGEPVGGMSKKQAENELRCSGKLADAFREYGYDGPTIPMALVEHDMPYKTKDKTMENIHACILRTEGNIRMDSIIGKLGKSNEMGLTEGSGPIRELVKKIASWVGFSNRLVMEQSIFPNDRSYGLDNFALFMVGEGYGISLVDFDNASSSQESHFKKEHVKIPDQLSSPLVEYQIFDRHSKENKSDIKGMIAIHGRDYFDIDQIDSGYGIVEMNAEMESVRQAYFEAFDSFEAPNPIGKKLVKNILDVPGYDKEHFNRMNMQNIYTIGRD
jgi:hypothetical protein